MRGAPLVVKLENDVHCAYQRNSWSALYHRALGLTPRALRKLKRECTWGGRRRAGRRRVAVALAAFAAVPSGGSALFPPGMRLQACATTSPPCPSSCT